MIGMIDNTAAAAADAPIRAAQYLRMSTDHQRYSTENQAGAIQEYAERNNILIVRTYADEGISGLTFKGRPGIQRLVADVESRNADFELVIVYDVSRWGRFQDVDESIYYEVRCRLAGVRLVFCGEQFANDDNIGSKFHRLVSSSAAREHSRVLSTKVHMGQTTLIRKGFRQGGPAGFGLRRLLVDDAGNPKIELRRLEHKSIQTDRVILVPGPPEEIEIVRRIYTDFVERGLTEQQIANRLNRQGILTDLERDWTRSTVRQVLTNEKYIGNNVWNKRSFKLKTKRVNNAPDLWVRAENAFEPIVDVGLFRAAQKIITTRSYRPNNDEMLEALQRVLKRHGYLSGLIIDEADTCPSASAYQSRFGSLLRTYKLIGYQPDRDYRYVDINRRLREQHPEVIANVVSRLRETGARVENDGANSLLVMNEEIRASLVLSRCHINASGGARWFIRFDTSLGADITIAARMEPGEQDIRDFYLLPALDCSGDKLRLFENNTNELDVYRFDTLDALYHLVRRTRIKDIL
ncbi:recombinase family protein [Brucella sp. 09RB8918]|uniref:recombinase family protein n=2 Tax=Brucella TaxID=234 RepID=UPI0017515AEA|nr:recombinase family protein [Brucella sp. 09RB8918]CAB4327317.1 hypothetical protein BCH_02714 [Brucella sp. 191011898]